LTVKISKNPAKTGKMQQMPAKISKSGKIACKSGIFT